MRDGTKGETRTHEFPNYQFGALPTWPPSYNDAFNLPTQAPSASKVDFYFQSCSPFRPLVVSLNQCRPSPYQLFNLRSYSTTRKTSLSLEPVDSKLLALWMLTIQHRLRRIVYLPFSTPPFRNVNKEIPISLFSSFKH